MTSFFQSFPKELEEAARIDGCSRFGVFFRVVLPVARPASRAGTGPTGRPSWRARPGRRHPVLERRHAHRRDRRGPAQEDGDRHAARARLVSKVFGQGSRVSPGRVAHPPYS
ncbi:ABC transporter permease subunit [Nonomuraea angiospora]|uniref:ABC transporter permease subunit n=1 Tax=Nonomuraea angiospora TaxID=46172 RepID=UPI00178B64F3|nr:ABC transporter permease subunit [Nonomuraea angiospora]